MKTSIIQWYLCTCPCGCLEKHPSPGRARCNYCERPGHQRLLDRLEALENVREAAKLLRQTFPAHRPWTHAEILLEARLTAARLAEEVPA